MKKFVLLGVSALAALAFTGCSGWEQVRSHSGGGTAAELNLTEPQEPAQIPAAPESGSAPKTAAAETGRTVAPQAERPPVPASLNEPDPPKGKPQQPAEAIRQAAPSARLEKTDKPAKKEKSEKKSLPVGQHRLSQKSMSLSEIRRKYADSFKVSGSAAEKKIALTFDDGPDDKYTAQVLDMLKKHQVKATFFVLGSRARQHPDLIARMVHEGHVIGNHTYSHANLPKLAVPNFEQQIESTQTVLKEMIGYEPKLFRPPYGAVNEEQARWAADHRFLIVNWNVDSLDWKGLSSDKVENNIVSATKAGSIILQHCGGGPGEDLSGTVEALPGIIRKLKNQGYQFVTVPELLHVPKSK